MRLAERLLAGVVAVAAGLTPSFSAVARDEPAGSATISPAAEVGPVVGWTHGKWSPDVEGDAKRAESIKRILKASAPVQNMQIMGWGLPNPEPSPGVFNFARMDRRVALMLETGQLPVITFCCAPDWMKGGAAGETDWNRFEKAPLPEHFDDFAKLSAVIAQRYPAVRHFQVWNELKGFWNTELNRWDHERYTDLYNKVYLAVKKVRPDAQIGGPYVIMTSYPNSTAIARNFGSELRGTWGTVDRRSLEVIEYWLKHKAGAQFIAVDGTVWPGREKLEVEPRAGLEKFRAVQDWIRQRTDLPVWWSELYPAPPDMPPVEAVQQAREALGMLGRGGASVVLFWNPACRQDVDYGQGICLWTVDAGGQVTPTELAEELQKRRPALPSPRQ